MRPETRFSYSTRLVLRRGQAWSSQELGAAFDLRGFRRVTWAPGRGEFSVQGHLDLHGLTRAEAKAQVDSFLQEARRKGKRCVVLVHGRGLHSKDQMPVLKEALRTWLATARFGRHVLAFATARPQDGGAGAVYVLLRKLGR